MAKKKHKLDKSVEIVRWSILGTVGLIITAFLIYAVLYSSGIFDSATEKYSTLTGHEAQTDHIEVVEFFSYECIHCQRLEQRLQEFEANLPENVSFSRVHVAFNVQARRLARTHVALQLSNAIEQNHDRIFQEAAKNKNSFNSLDKIADFLDGHGISKSQFENLYQGRRVQALVSRNAEKSAELGLLGTPSLFVANKYVIHPNNTPAVMMQTLQQLLSDIRAGKLPLPEEEEEPESDLHQIDEIAPDEEFEEPTSEEEESSTEGPNTKPESPDNTPENSDSSE